LLPSVAICLVISFIPSLHQVANFSWFIGAGLAAGCYRFIAREDREAEDGARWQGEVMPQKNQATAE
ncbi:MAG TPA: nitrate reductase, partial [Pantoea agglomerans]|nr:nitrate reductase [Pantoea agglomerans]